MNFTSNSPRLLHINIFYISDGYDFDDDDSVSNEDNSLDSNPMHSR